MSAIWRCEKLWLFLAWNRKSQRFMAIWWKWKIWTFRNSDSILKLEQRCNFFCYILYLSPKHFILIFSKCPVTNASMLLWLLMEPGERLLIKLVIRNAHEILTSETREKLIISTMLFASWAMSKRRTLIPLKASKNILLINFSSFCWFH